MEVNMENVKQNKKINWGKVLEYTLPAIVSMVIFLIAMIIKGVYPFGTAIIGYIDYSPQLVPAMTGIWDIFHGYDSFFVDWRFGAGGSLITSNFTTVGFCSPLNWLICLFPRESIIYSISVIIIIKIMLMATTAYICFKKFFPSINQYTLLVFTIIWTFSGWFLVHYTNICWLDLMIFLPLLLISLKNLVEKGKIFWFVLILAYMLMLSYYISYMVLVGLVIVALLYIIMLAKERKKIASLLFYGVITAILISMVIFIPSCITSLQAHRFANVAEITRFDLIDPTLSKLAILMLTPLPLVVFIKLLCTYKKDKKNVLFFMLGFIILSIGIIIEPINAMWHTGSYFSYPFRYSFINILFMIFGSLYYINKYSLFPTFIINESEEISSNKKPSNLSRNILLPIVIILGLMSVGFAFMEAIVALPAHPLSNRSITELLPMIFFVITAFPFFWFINKIVLSDNNRKRKFVTIFTVIIVALQTIILSTGFLGVNSASLTSQVTNCYTIPSEKIVSPYKVKDREQSYTWNFSQLAEVPTMQTWIHINNTIQFQAYELLGYNNEGSTPLHSSGGTLMTDILLGNKYVLSREELNTDIYTKFDSFSYQEQIDDGADTKEVTMYLYEINAEIPEVFTTNVDITTMFEGINTSDLVLVQNTIYQKLFNQTEDIMTIGTYSVTETNENFIITIPKNENMNTLLELIPNIDSFSGLINNKVRNFSNGFNDLGYLDSDLEITIKKSSTANKNITLEFLQNNLRLTHFDTTTFLNVYNNVKLNESSLKLNGKHLDISINNSLGHKYALVSYNYLNNMVGTNNGTNIDVDKAFIGFMQVELDSSNTENNITLTYSPQLIKICLIITIVAIIIFVIFSLINYKWHIANNKVITWIGVIGASIILGVVGFLVYLKPLFNFFTILI